MPSKRHLPKPSAQRDLSDAVTCAKFLDRQLGQAAEDLINGPRPVDADAPLSPSEDERDRVMKVWAAASGQPRRAERENVSGLPAIPADNSSHDQLEAQIVNRWPGRLVVGEEASEAKWDAWEKAPPGTETMNLDALDGSSLYDSVSFGYGATAGLYRRNAEGQDELVYTVTVNSSGFGMIYLARHDAVFVGRPPFSTRRMQRKSEASLPPADTIRPGVVACVAARPEHRRLVAQLFDTVTGGWGLPPTRDDPDPSLTTLTLGGAPAAVGMVIGRLAALVIPAPQTLHDAAPMIALAALNIPMFDEHGARYGYPTLKKRFNALARPNAGEAYHPIPRLVFARDPDFGNGLASRTFTFDPNGGPGSGELIARQPDVEVVRQLRVV